MSELLTQASLGIVIAGFLVGIVVGLTGMGGGALMTPALIFLGVGDAATVVTADLTAAAVSKSGGAIVHARQGSPNLQIAKWLMLGSIPMALIGPFLVRALTDDTDAVNTVLQYAIGFALFFAAGTYALRLYINLRRVRRGNPDTDENPPVRPIPTLLVGMLGGLLVGITSVGSGSVIMIALLTLYPGLNAVRLVGTDLVQAVPLVLAAAISNIYLTGLDFGVLIPLLIGSIPGTLLGAKIAPKVPQSIIRRGIVVVLTASGVALLGKAGFPPLVDEAGDFDPFIAAYVGIAMVILVPLVWGFIRKSEGLPMMGAPYVYELENDQWHKKRARSHH
ncbi:sulfite exporter TauE/SafE family protein [Nocardioidaceae bacterium]|nr:sulfite exporter TauE/SafE family protein [Nocardioidaceae bacterium]